jgi:hypothetical protein
MFRKTSYWFMLVWCIFYLERRKLKRFLMVVMLYSLPFRKIQENEKSLNVSVILLRQYVCLSNELDR